MDGSDLSLVGLIDKVDHSYCVVLRDKIDIGRCTWWNMHLLDQWWKLNPFNYLMKLEIADEKVFTLADVADVTGKIIVQEDGLSLILFALFIVDQVTLG